MQTSHQPIRAHDDWSLGHPILVLLNGFEIFPSSIRLPDRARSQV